MRNSRAGARHQGERGGQIAASLDSLYEYMSGRLLTANINNAPAIVEEVQRLLTELRDAWNAIADTPAATGINHPNLASA